MKVVAVVEPMTKYGVEAPANGLIESKPKGVVEEIPTNPVEVNVVVAVWPTENTFEVRKEEKKLVVVALVPVAEVKVRFPSVEIPVTFNVELIVELALETNPLLKYQVKLSVAVVEAV